MEEAIVKTSWCDTCTSYGPRHRKVCPKYSYPARTKEENIVAVVSPAPDLTNVLTDIVKQLAEIKASIVDTNLRVTAAEVTQAGGNSRFEAELKKETGEVVELSAAEISYYGEKAGDQIIAVVRKVLGADFSVFAKADSAAPVTMVTIIPPIRIVPGQNKGVDQLGKKIRVNDFRSRVVANAAILPEVKKFCELVKSSLFREATMFQRESPVFKIDY